LCIVDTFSRFCHLLTLSSTTSEAIAQKIYDDVICTFGPPEVLRTDQGRNVHSQLIKDVCDALGIKKTASVPYSPRGQAEAERRIGWAKQLIASAAYDLSVPWTKVVKPVQYTLNSTTCRTTKCSPMLAYTGREGRTELSIAYGLPPEYNDNVESTKGLALAEMLRHLYKRCRENFQLYATRESGYYKAKSAFPVNSRVWLFTPFLAHAKSRALAMPHRWTGSWRVTAVPCASLRTLVPEGNWAKNPDKVITVSVDRLKPFREELDLGTRLVKNSRKLQTEEFAIPDEHVELGEADADEPDAHVSEPEDPPAPWPFAGWDHQAVTAPVPAPEEAENRPDSPRPGPSGLQRPLPVPAPRTQLPSEPPRPRSETSQPQAGTPSPPTLR
ncbi:MAG: DDE-type integrase/transposase/recombinase, partial [Gammaproteobacteria bacterium]|nr:DDE-type integrase/transposase/recombinase [Gammaproteobacteria bacterium]